MLRKYFAFVKKETFHILRDPRTLAILLGMPIALVLIFGYTVTNEFKDASIAIVDEAKDDLSRELIADIISSGHLQLVSMPDNIFQLEDAFKNGSVKMGIIIPADFENSFYRDKSVKIQLLTDGSEPNYATTLTSYASRMIRSFQMEKMETPDLPYQIEVETRMFYNPKLIGAYYFIPGVVALILMLICAMMTSLTIAKEKETGTMDLLLVSPLNPMLIIIGKVTPYAILSFINALIVLAMGYYIFDVPILGSLPLLLALCLLYLLVALGMGVLISTRADSQQTAMMASLFTLMMPTMLLSGFIFPIASMPTVLQYISKIIPAKYFIIIEKAIMLKGSGWETIYQPSFVLVGMLLFFLLASFKNFKVIYK